MTERLTVLHVHFKGWAIGDLAHPQVQIFALASFSKQYVIAVVDFGELVQLVEL